MFAKGRKKGDSPRFKWPRWETLFLAFFFIFFLLLFGLLLYHGQTRWKKEHPSTMVTIKDARENPAVLAIRGLIIEEGGSGESLFLQSTDDGLLLEFHGNSAFSAEKFRRKLNQILPSFGYDLTFVSHKDEGQMSEKLFVLRPSRENLPPLSFKLFVPSPPSVPERPAAFPEKGKARLAIVIDDLGLRLDLATEMISIPAPLTLSIMPGQPYSQEVSRLTSLEGKEVLLHLPMEPLDFPAKDPGPGALMSGMSAEEINQILENDFLTVPGAVGVNNHMGSRLTADEAVMDRLMPWLAREGMIFLDSRTSPHSVAYERARFAGLKSLRSDIFLDNFDELPYIKKQINSLVKIALQKGQAVGIGHPRPNTAAAIRESLEDIKEAGVEIVPLSELAHE